MTFLLLSSTVAMIWALTPKLKVTKIIKINKETKNKEEDYYICLSRLGIHAGYITINISSPNTEGLRNFHDQEEMKKLLSGINKIIKEKKNRMSDSYKNIT